MTINTAAILVWNSVENLSTLPSPRFSRAIGLVLSYFRRKILSCGLRFFGLVLLGMSLLSGFFSKIVDFYSILHERSLYLIYNNYYELVRRLIINVFEN